VYNEIIPKLHDIRRVPLRYQTILPPGFSQQHQCVVLGADSRMFTVGIVRQKNEELLLLLRLITNAAIFPVLIEPRRMRLLIARMERYRRFSQRFTSACYIVQLPVQMRLLLVLSETGKPKKH
jgi:hypothetical protein